MTCPNGTFTRDFAPHVAILATSGVTDLLKVSPDGTLAGTASPWQGSNTTANYSWRLVPDR
jgi:hypothetical protein